MIAATHSAMEAESSNDDDLSGESIEAAPTSAGGGFAKHEAFGGSAWASTNAAFACMRMEMGGDVLWKKISGAKQYLLIIAESLSYASKFHFLKTLLGYL